MKFKRLIVLVNSFPMASETFIVSNIVAAIEKGFEVNIIANDIRTIKSSSQEDLLRKFKILEKIVSVKLPTKKYKRYLFCIFCLMSPVVLFYFIKYSWRIKKIKLNILFKIHYYKPFRKADIYHVHFATAAEEIPLLKQIGFIKSKLLVTFHGYDAFFKDNTQQEVLKRNYRVLFQVADKVTVNTPYLKSIVIALDCPESLLAVVPVGVDLDFFKPTIYPKKINSINFFRIISIGRSIELKGHEFGIRVVKKLIDKGFNISYTIIGEGVLLDKLKFLSIELGVQEAVTFLGKGTQEEILEAFDIAHLFLMTSVMDIIGREEAQGVVTAEAQAMGLPVIGFKSGGVPYTVSKDTGVLVAQKDINALAEEIAIILQDPIKYQAMSLAARKWVKQNFNLNTMVDDYYKDLM